MEKDCDYCERSSRKKLTKSGVLLETPKAQVVGKKCGKKLGKKRENRQRGPGVATMEKLQ